MCRISFCLLWSNDRLTEHKSSTATESGPLTPFGVTKIIDFLTQTGPAKGALSTQLVRASLLLTRSHLSTQCREAGSATGRTTGSTRRRRRTQKEVTSRTGIPRVRGVPAKHFLPTSYVCVTGRIRTTRRPMTRGRDMMKGRDVNPKKSNLTILQIGFTYSRFTSHFYQVDSIGDRGFYGGT